jgi:hypothetical protein
VGDYYGVLTYMENTGTSTAPVFVQRTGSANPFDGIDSNIKIAPAFGDLDGDGMLRPRPSIDKLRRFASRAGDPDLVVGDDSGNLNYFANGFCTTSCSGRGVCDGSANLLPTCDCLTGFMGGQCDECQAGYYGSTCALCPESGNETKSAPRVTDTCGVAGSGWSRGTCDDGFVGSGNCTCFEEHFSGAGCSKGACLAGTIEGAKKNGLFYETYCEPCPPGYRGDDDNNCIKCDRNEYSAAGADTCVACDPGLFSGSGASICEACPLGSYDPSAHDDQQYVKCPSPSTTVVTGATGCNTCNEGFYFSPFPVYAGRDGMEPVRCDNLAALAAQCQDEDDTACFDQCCRPCKKGMNCRDPANNTLQALAIEDGWWRDTLFSDHVYPCEYADSCKAGLCTTGHKGVACRVCEAGYHYSSMDGRCMECPGSGKRPNLVLVIGVFIFLVVMLGIFLYCYVRRSEMLFVFQVDYRTLIREGLGGLMSRAAEEAKQRAVAKANDAAVGAIAGEEEDDEAAQGRRERREPR